MSGAALAADTVIRNANIITVDPRRPGAQALAIHNGKLVVVGGLDDVRNLHVNLPLFGSASSPLGQLLLNTSSICIKKRSSWQSFLRSIFYFGLFPWV